jgi:hypothetical protein
MYVKITEITPEGATRADVLGALSNFALFVFLFFVAVGAGNALVWILCLGSLFFAYPIFVQHFYLSMAKSTEVMFTPTEFRVKAEGGSWKIYNRTLTHRFMMMKHDKAREEREKHERKIRRAQARNEVISPKRYFDESYHIIFDYLGQRFDVVTIYDQKRATAVAARLKSCDKIMDTKNQMGEGEVLSPSEQWGDTPGSLP